MPSRPIVLHNHGPWNLDLSKSCHNFSLCRSMAGTNSSMTRPLRHRTALTAPDIWQMAEQPWHLAAAKPLHLSALKAFTRPASRIGIGHRWTVMWATAYNRSTTSGRCDADAEGDSGPMELYIIRHGLAHPLGQKNDFTDEKRTSTSQGRDRIREIAKGLRKRDVRPELVLTSPLIRAQETAEIVADSLGVDKQMLVTTPHLAPDSPFEELLVEIKEKHVESIALVGHEPDLGELAGLIISGEDQVALPLRKGGVCCINITATVPT